MGLFLFDLEQHRVNKSSFLGELTSKIHGEFHLKILLKQEGANCTEMKSRIWKCVDNSHLNKLEN